MLQPNPLPENGQQPLPLFRAEAMAAQQQKFYGEILLIRPFSLALFFWLGMGISVLVLGFLLLGTVRERIRATGVFLTQESIRTKAEVYVPEPVIKFVQVGETVPVHCPSCSGLESQITAATVSDISKSPSEPAYKVALTFPLSQAGRFPEGARLEADFPGQRRPLLKWLFERGQ